MTEYTDNDKNPWKTAEPMKPKPICSVCIGSFLLAAASLLEGRRAVTHWMYCSLLAVRHPDVSVEPDAIFVRDGSIWSSAVVTTGIELALALIEQDLGHQATLTVARVLVVYLKRAGGQSQYSALLAAPAESENDAFADLARWVAEHLTEDLSTEALAARVNMSPTNFARVYSELQDGGALARAGYREASIDQDRSSGNESRFVRAEPHCNVRNILRSADSAQRSARRQRRDDLFTVGTQHWSVDNAGIDVINAYSLVSDLKSDRRIMASRPALLAE